MRVILEGPDNAGKTTLARYITGLCPTVKYYHPGGKPANFEAEQECVIEQSKWLYFDNCILDRVTPISQRVYNPDLTLDRVRARQWQDFQDMDPVVIYCRPSLDRLMRVEDFTWRDGETEEHKQKIIRNQHEFIQRYDKLMQTIPNISYDLDNPLAGTIASKLVQAFNGSSESEKWFHMLLNYRTNFGV